MGLTVDVCLYCSLLYLPWEVIADGHRPRDARDSSFTQIRHVNNVLQCLCIHSLWMPGSFSEASGFSFDFGYVLSQYRVDLLD